MVKSRFTIPLLRGCVVEKVHRCVATQSHRQSLLVWVQQARTPVDADASQVMPTTVSAKVRPYGPHAQPS